MKGFSVLCFFVSLGYIPGNSIVGSHGSSMYIALGGISVLFSKTHADRFDESSLLHF